MVISAESVGESRRQVVSVGIALLCLAGVLLDAGADLPDEPVVWIVTPLRLVVGVGLVAAVVGLWSPLRLRTGLDPAVAGLVLATALATAAEGQDWSGWRAVATAVAVYYLAVAVRRTSFGSPGVIGLVALGCVALAAITAVRQGARRNRDRVLPRCGQRVGGRVRSQRPGQGDRHVLQPEPRVRLPLLADTPAVVRFASCEPLLGALDIRPWLGGGLDWLIAGGESGPKARPMHPDWARSLRDQCQAAGVAFFFKQWGAWRPAEAADAAHRRAPVALDGPVGGGHVGAAAMVRVGKTAAGRLLDGRMWDEFPRTRAKAGVGGG